MGLHFYNLIIVKVSLILSVTVLFLNPCDVVAQIFAPEVQVQPTLENNVGIGVPDPQKTLDVNGDGRFSSSLEVNGDSRFSSSLDIGLVRNPNSSLEGLNIHSNSGGSSTNFQFAEQDNSGSHAIFFNAYKSKLYEGGSLKSLGNSKYANEPGNYTNGAGAIMFMANGGTFDFLISPESTGKDNNIDWGTPKMRIKRNGYVAIGFENPQFNLDVNGTGHFSSTLNVDGNSHFSSALDIGLPRNSNGTSDGLNIHSGAGGNYTNIQFAETSFSASHAMLFNAYKSQSGVSGNLSATGNTKFSNDPGDHGNGAGAIMFFGNGGNIEFFISPASNGKDNDISWGGSKMKIMRKGFVGIGKNPGYKLDVDGTVRATTFSAVSPPWSDFVFEKDYKLISLEAVEEFVNKNKHLPDVPAAREVEEKGIDLAKMDAILLQKIEELTLYLIELKKENDNLKLRINELEGRKTER